MVMLMPCWHAWLQVDPMISMVIRAGKMLVPKSTLEGLMIFSSWQKEALALELSAYVDLSQVPSQSAWAHKSCPPQHPPLRLCQSACGPL